jgi:hypothetical protein
MPEEGKTMLDQLEENLDAAIARQQAGRVRREDCVERMIEAALGMSRNDHAAMDAALDAALASGYVIRP